MCRQFSVLSRLSLLLSCQQNSLFVLVVVEMIAERLAQIQQDAASIKSDLAELRSLVTRQLEDNLAWIDSMSSNAPKEDQIPKEDQVDEPKEDEPILRPANRDEDERDEARVDDLGELGPIPPVPDDVDEEQSDSAAPIPPPRTART